MADAAPTSSEGAAPIDFDFEEFMKDAKTWTADERSEYAEGLEPALFAENSAELSMSPDDVAAMTALQEEGMDNDEIAEHWKNRGNECMKAAAEQKKKGKGGKKKGQKAAAAAAAAAAAPEPAAASAEADGGAEESKGEAGADDAEGEEKKEVKAKMIGTPKQFWRNAVGFYDKAIHYAERVQTEAADADADADADAKAAQTQKQKHSAILSNRAAANLLLKNYGSVRRDCVAAIELHPGNIKAYYRAAKASSALKKWEEAARFATAGIKAEEKEKEKERQRAAGDGADSAAAAAAAPAPAPAAGPGAELGKLLATATAQLKAQREKERKERQRQKLLDWNVARMTRACATRNIRMGPRVFMDRYADYKATPTLDKGGGMTWPVLFLYDEYAQSDFVQAFDEKTVLAQQLAMMFPLEPDAPPAPWDERHEYRADKLELYVQEDIVPAFTAPAEWRAYFVREEGVLRGDGADAEQTPEERRRAAADDPEKKAWVQVPMGATLLQALQHARYVVPTLPMIHVIVTGSDFARTWKEGKRFKPLALRQQ